MTSLEGIVIGTLIGAALGFWVYFWFTWRPPD